jgi:cell division protein FtsW
MSPAPVLRPAVSARYALLGSTLLLSLGGLLMIYSASSASDFARFKDSAYHLKPQAAFLIVGIAALWACSHLTPEFVRRLGWWVLIGSDAALLLVLAMGVGKYGATRWLDLGFTTLQPSEFAKLGCVLVVAEILADRERRHRPIKDDLVKLLLVVGVPFLLVMLQPDMGTAMSILMTVFFVLVLGGLQMRWVLATAAGIAIAVPLLIVGRDYRTTRFLGFLDPYADPLGKGYQIIQAQLAFGSGGLLGLGLGLSRQKFSYLPAAHTDFIFAIIGEELGLLGTLTVVLAFGVMCYAGIRIALSIKDPYARLVAGGLTMMIVTAAVINMASVTGLMPVTGIPLPLVSYGGTSLLFTMGCIGLILAMTRGRDRASARQRPPVVEAEGNAGASTGKRRGDGRPHLSGIDGGRARPRRRA